MRKQFELRLPFHFAASLPKIPPRQMEKPQQPRQRDSLRRLNANLVIRFPAPFAVTSTTIFMDAECWRSEDTTWILWEWCWIGKLRQWKKQQRRCFACIEAKSIHQRNESCGSERRVMDRKIWRRQYYRSWRSITSIHCRLKRKQRVKLKMVFDWLVDSLNNQNQNQNRPIRLKNWDWRWNLRKRKKRQK